MKTATTAERLSQLMRQRDLRQVDILRLCQPYCEKYGIKLNRNDLSQYVNGKVEPSQFKLTILAAALGVTEPWLMGYDDGTVVPCVFPGANYSADTAEIADLVEQLEPIDRAEIRGAVKTLLRQEKYQNKKGSAGA